MYAPAIHLLLMVPVVHVLPEVLFLHAHHLRHLILVHLVYPVFTCVLCVCGISECECECVFSMEEGREGRVHGCKAFV